jgi:hypothetical protein
VRFDTVLDLCNAHRAASPFCIVEHLLLAETTEDHFQRLAGIQRVVSVAVGMKAVEAGRSHGAYVPFGMSRRAY